MKVLFSVHVTDSSDPNWWKGYNERGEGLFPANFVSEETSAAATEPERPAGAGAGAEAGARAAEEASSVPERIDPEALEAALALLHEADPSAAGSAEEEARLARLEARAAVTGALVDAALERADTRHARLTQLSAELVDALNLYHSLMRDPLKQPYAPAPAPAPYPPPPPPPPHAFAPHAHAHHQLPPR